MYRIKGQPPHNLPALCSGLLGGEGGHDASFATPPSPHAQYVIYFVCSSSYTQTTQSWVDLPRAWCRAAVSSMPPRCLFCYPVWALILVRLYIVDDDDDDDDMFMFDHSIISVLGLPCRQRAHDALPALLPRPLASRRLRCCVSFFFFFFSFCILHNIQLTPQKLSAWRKSHPDAPGAGVFFFSSFCSHGPHPCLLC